MRHKGTKSHNLTQLQSVELQRLAIRMRRELDLKDRMLHLQAYRNTFTGPQAVTWLTSSVGGGAGSSEEAVELATRMLRAGFIKNVAHRDTFTGREGDVLKFVSAALPPRDAESSSGGGDYSKSQLKKIGSGFSKEIVKLGKAAAEPFKKIERAMDTISDTISDYYYGFPCDLAHKIKPAWHGMHSKLLGPCIDSPPC
ncbi:hypothetical protein MNEG_11228 [Monoraphidium neglectum]|uniref:DEP domain-containing protein n=1 Tax=Monoraphidium neglectum TaxID=145388 RepID=A0A0D2M696_9CHLO|nr:hypothetical protein MNEG_11228 [Monoraphidium neglectum]KIY96736.1 hypothetical protein MNEG_11228 [Monoraphidium neglectum]|eukprot:XP_013895756.1 hypothetical protein MNEG_11228 [Monoraphidium neglectum]